RDLQGGGGQAGRAAEDHGPVDQGQRRHDARRGLSDRPAIDARAAARPELGGVERWARELCARLPYTVHRPPALLSHAAGHAWEQALLPVLSARAPALLCPANLAPVAARNVVVVIHDAASLRHPGWYSGLYAAWQRRAL